MARLFVAALPSPETTAMLRSIPKPDHDGVRWVPDGNWHVTLRFIGEAERTRVIDLLDDAELPAAEAVLGPRTEWLGGQLVVPVAGVDDLAAAVRAATASIGGHDSNPFRGHLTIARTRRGRAAPAAGSEVSARFAVTEVAVVESDLRPTGAVYTPLATCPVGESFRLRRD